MSERRVINGVLYEKGADGVIRRVGGAPTAQPSVEAISLPRAPTEVAKENRDIAGAERDETRTGIAVRGEGRDIANQQFSHLTKLAGDYNADPAVKSYRVAVGQLAQAINTGEGPQADLALTYAFAKAMDPDSVVREAEQGMVSGSQSFWDSAAERVKKQFGMDGAGLYTPETREQIRKQISNSVAQRAKVYDARRNYFEQQAQALGVNPQLVIGQHDATPFVPLVQDWVKRANGIAEPGAMSKLGDLPPAYQQAYDAFIKSGNFTPEQYAAFRTGLDRAFFPDAEDQTALYMKEGAQIIENGGVPGGGGVIPGVNQPMGAVEGAINTSMQHPAGTFAADAVNASLGGLPARLSGNQDDLEALRAMNPKSALGGQVVGGIAGALGAGKLLGAATRFAPAGAQVAMRNPLVGDMAYGTVYGATQDDNPFKGAMIGAASALGGGIVGQRVGDALPGLFNPAGVRAADNAVPSGQQLRDLASQQYQAVEAAGQVAGENATQELADSTQQLLAGQGRVTPRGNLIDVNNSISRANQLIQDFAGAPMTPTQAQSVRGVLGDGLTAMDNGAPDNAQRRIAGMMIDRFDEWAEPALPGIDQARETASRYLQGDQIAAARGIADANEQWFTQSGPDNAIRNSFRNLDRDAVRGKSRMPERVNNAIETVTRGTPFSNAARWLGKLAPTGAIPIAGAASLGGAAAMGGAGATGGLLTGAIMGAGMVGRGIANNRTRRAADIAELMARGGPEYEAALAAATDIAVRRGGLFGGGLGAATGSAVSR